MTWISMPCPLRLRLRQDATVGLLELLDLSHEEARESVITACTERFERRLVEEVSEVRVQLAHVESSLRQEIARSAAGLRQEIATGRVELFKWCFLFWVGQVLAIGGMMGVMLRLAR